ncbi:thiamine pyrophosphate-binding protein [Anaerovibrio slackiae]|uniref:thiamine pyrophosphate-binding protein n=1 Tax=Anaerovibrio slackiae TaxID=2652309 RepID=UPI003868F0F2
MRIKVTDYIAEFLVSKGINQIFTVVGGGSMHLNDSFGHHAKLSCIYNHHEQASAIAAEAYARVNNKMAVTCVTSGPGAVNALTGVVGAYQDSIPMLVFSGQAKTGLCIKSSGLNIRTIGGQEVDIVPAIQQNMVKYAEMIMDANKIRYCLEKAYAIAISGRPGPCWLDIPLDIQGSFIETDNLEGFCDDSVRENPSILSNDIEQVVTKLLSAKRPVLYAGNGIRLSGGMDVFKELVETLRIPVVTCWNSIDLIGTDNPLYCGRGGNMGDRAGNFAVQNSDFLLCIGTRLGIYQVGWHVEKWARQAFTVVVDIDPEELKKKIMRADMPICADAKEFMQALLSKLKETSYCEQIGWLEQCRKWKMQYPVVRREQYEEKNVANTYAFLDSLSRLLPNNAMTVVANGSASVMGSQSYYIKQDDRFFMNCALSSMGYAVPAAIGVCAASGRRKTICIEGDGSIMMNLQELQTVVTNKMPIKIFIINNNGYHQVRQTQDNIFHNGYIGMGPESGDLGFPDFKKLADAFGIPYLSIRNNGELKSGIQQVLNYNGYILCEVFVSTTQKFEPKSATKKLDDGTLISPPLEDMAPFLSRAELAENMYIPMLPEE